MSCGQFTGLSRKNSGYFTVHRQNEAEDKNINNIAELNSAHWFKPTA